MSRCRRIVVIVTAVLIHVLAGSEAQGVDSQKVPLDVYCSNLTSEGYSYSSKPRLDKYQRICWDVDKYIKCIIDNRITRVTTLPFVVQPFERFFPSEYELASATYMLCSQNLIE
ncbi:unnamed protein product, partial [Candidula unifasciata]